MSAACVGVGSGHSDGDDNLHDGEDLPVVGRSDVRLMVLRIRERETVNRNSPARQSTCASRPNDLPDDTTPTSTLTRYSKIKNSSWSVRKKHSRERKRKMAYLFHDGKEREEGKGGEDEVS